MMHFDTILTRARRWLATGAVAFAATIVAVVPAHGQFGESGFSDLATRDYLHRDMPIAAQVLELDENQRMILDNLFEDYVDEFESGWQATQESITKLLDNGQSIDRENVLDMVIQPFESWQTKKQQLKQQFESGVRSILNERQVELWPSFERRMLREKRLHQGRLSGESVNLFDIVRDLRLDERSRMNIEPILEEYAVELHEALKRRTDAVRTMSGDIFQAIRSQQNISAQTNAAKALIDYRVAVRDINDRYRDRLASSLPHEAGQELKAAALERGYPRVYRELPAMRAYRQALELDELDEETRADVHDLYVVFDAEMDVFTNRLLTMLREFEPRQLRNEVDVYVARQQGERAERITDPTRSEFRQRNDRATYYASLLRDVLGDEMLAKLPAGSRLVDDAARRAAAAEARQRIQDRRQGAERGGQGERGMQGERGGRGERQRTPRQREQRDQRRGDSPSGTREP